jgi:hypothetical protein
VALRSESSPFFRFESGCDRRTRRWRTVRGGNAGCLFPIGKHVEFNPYYEHQNNTGKSPNQQLNQLGLMLSLYFSVS